MREPELSVVVPAYNEERRLAKSLPRLFKALKVRFETFEIIVVDDGSADRTSAVVEGFARHHEGVRLIRYRPNRGKGCAVRTGVLASGGRHVLICDADLSTPLREVRKLLAAIAEGCDVAVGSRSVSGSRILVRQPLYRELLGKTFNKIVRLLTVRGIVDTQCGFKCFTGEAAREIFSRCRIDGFAFDVEALYVARKRGMKIKEVGVLWRNDPDSRVSTGYHSLEMLRDVIVIASRGLFGA